MSEVSIKIHESEYKANLTIEAMERIEASFNFAGLGQILQTQRGLRTAKVIILACVMASNSQAKPKKVEEQLNLMAEAEGIDALWEPVLELVEASGLMGKKKAKEQETGN